MPLTDLQCRNARCVNGIARQRLSDGEGMYLEVVPTGARYWRLKYRIGGKEKRLSLGVYPRVSLVQARQARKEARDLIAKGIDPSLKRQQEKVAEPLAPDQTFETVARAWHKHWKSARSDHHADYVIRRLAADVFPEIGSYAIETITAPACLVDTDAARHRITVDA